MHHEVGEGVPEIHDMLSGGVSHYRAGFKHPYAQGLHGK